MASPPLRINCNTWEFRSTACAAAETQHVAARTMAGNVVRKENASLRMGSRLLLYRSKGTEEFIAHRALSSSVGVPHCGWSEVVLSRQLNVPGAIICTRWNAETISC